MQNLRCLQYFTSCFDCAPRVPAARARRGACRIARPHEYFYTFVRAEMLTDDRGARRGGPCKTLHDEFRCFTS